MSTQDVKINVMNAVINAKVSSVSKAELDDTFRVDQSNVIYYSEQKAEEAAERSQLLNILVSIAESLELDWGYNGRLIEITLPKDKQRGNCNFCEHTKTMVFIPRQEPCAPCFNTDNRPNWKPNA